MLNLIPGNREVIAILAAHVQGAYHFVHDALKPYVQLAPAVLGQSIVVKSSPQLQLLRHAISRQVYDTMTFVIMFQGSGLQLVEVLPMTRTEHAVGVPRALNLGDVLGDVVAEGEHPQVPPKPRAPKIRVTPEPLVEPAPPPISIPEAYHAFCATHDVHPELGDYVVIPQGEDQAAAVPWMIASPLVTDTHVVKRRLGTDEVVSGEL